MKKTLKKVAAIMLAVGIIASCFAGCTTDTNKKDKKYTIGICQLVQHEALDEATKGFIDAVNEILGKENVEIKEQNAAGDSPTCATICNQFVASNVDLIMANATPALQAAAAATTTIPIVATSITDYSTALEITDWNGKTGMNVTGTADLAPLEEQAKMIKELVPDAKTVGILYCSAEANSKYQATEVAKYLEAMGLKTKEYTAADSNDVSSVTTLACDESDVLYIPTDNTMASNTGIISSIVEDSKTPVIAGEEGICKGCGIGSLSINYYTIGYNAGKMAADILQNGTDPGTMEIEYDNSPVKKYMEANCEKLGITVPDGYEKLNTDAE